ncbi:MAG TPA: serine protease, partial [Pseudolabrys sp.]|nr:serine protease [Pseudolabrys sp.]
GGGGVSVGNVLARIYDSLVYWDVFSEIPLSGNLIFDFQINFLVVQNYQQRGILENIVKGPALIPARYNAAIAAIVIEKDKQESIGSGSVVSHNGKVFVLTNRHVVDPSEQIKICKVLLADKDYPPPSPSNLVISNNDDLAAFPISVPEDGPKFSLGDAAYVLQEVILLGFPKIPLTKRPHLTAHSGEINATIVTRNDEELYLISNYASPGSSGGPLIDYRGLIIGVVSDSLEAEYEEAIFQHSAAVTLPRVRMFLESKVLSAFS